MDGPKKNHKYHCVESSTSREASSTDDKIEVIDGEPRERSPLARHLAARPCASSAVTPRGNVAERGARVREYERTRNGTWGRRRISRLHVRESFTLLDRPRDDGDGIDEDVPGATGGRPTHQVSALEFHVRNAKYSPRHGRHPALSRRCRQHRHRSQDARRRRCHAGYPPSAGFHFVSAWLDPARRCAARARARGRGGWRPRSRSRSRLRSWSCKRARHDFPKISAGTLIRNRPGERSSDVLRFSPISLSLSRGA